MWEISVKFALLGQKVVGARLIVDEEMRFSNNRMDYACTRSHSSPPLVSQRHM